jgi:hypothetical protein
MGPVQTQLATAFRQQGAYCREARLGGRWGRGGLLPTFWGQIQRRDSEGQTQDHTSARGGMRWSEEFGVALNEGSTWQKHDSYHGRL